jgi:hypothetical protein
MAGLMVDDRGDPVYAQSAARIKDAFRVARRQ